MINSMTVNFKKAMSIISGKLWQLCGLILLGELLMALASTFGFAPIISYPLKWTLEVGICVLSLKCVRGQQTGSKDLFSGFQNFKHVACGMAWKTLWVAIWLIVPVYAFVQIIKPFISELFSAIFKGVIYEFMSEVLDIYPYGGFEEPDMFSVGATGVGMIIITVIFVIAIIVCCVFAIIKEIHYSFTPYILTDKPEIHCMDAIKKSKEMTRGIRGGIFGAVAIPALIVAAADLILGLLSKIPYIGVLFFLINVAFGLLSTVFLAIFTNLVLASYYNNAAAGIPAPGAAMQNYYQNPNNGGYNPYPNNNPNAAPNNNPAPNGYDPYTGKPK